MSSEGMNAATEFPRDTDGVIVNDLERSSQPAGTAEHETHATQHMMSTDVTDVGFFNHGSSKSTKSKNITLDLLIKDGVLEPAECALSVKYLGKVITADLLDNGKIRSNDTGEVYNTPSSWAINCKKSINPAKTSGCGWGSIRYKGKSLDLYKSKWVKDNMDSTSGSPITLTPVNMSRVSTPKLEASPLFHSRNSSPAVVDVKPINPTDLLYPAMSGLPLMEYDKNISTQVRCEGVDFSVKAVFYPSACLSMAEMSVSSKDEVSGYLAGSYNQLTNVLTVQMVYNKTDSEARTKVTQNGMVLAGWFHSHPDLSYYPSVYDVECQMNYQLRLRDQPIISCIIGKKHIDDDSSLSMMCYTVSPPKLKFSERFGCLSDKCGKPKSVQWTLERSPILQPFISEKKLELFMENVRKDMPA